MEIDFGTRLKEVRHLHTGSLKVSVRNPSPRSPCELQQQAWEQSLDISQSLRTAARQSYRDPTDNTQRPEGVNTTICFHRKGSPLLLWRS